LLERLRANEPDAWRAMVQLYTPLVYHWCARGGVGGEDALDVSQEVFRVAATSMDHFRREHAGDTFRGWLRGITRNVLHEHYRRRSRQPQAAGGTDAFQKLHELADPTMAASWDDTDDAPAEMDGLHRRAVDLVRKEFEERTWRAFWQTAIEGRSPVDVATEEGVSPAAIRMAKSRVLRRLKEEFADLIQ
jgi:RNA polymerase sigma-70 factor (ECF subfamily)